MPWPRGGIQRITGAPLVARGRRNRVSRRSTHSKLIAKRQKDELRLAGRTYVGGVAFRSACAVSTRGELELWAYARSASKSTLSDQPGTRSELP